MQLIEIINWFLPVKGDTRSDSSSQYLSQVTVPIYCIVLLSLASNFAVIGPSQHQYLAGKTKCIGW